MKQSAIDELARIVGRQPVNAEVVTRYLREASLRTGEDLWPAPGTGRSVRVSHQHATNGILALLMGTAVEGPETVRTFRKLTTNGYHDFRIYADGSCQFVSQSCPDPRESATDCFGDLLDSLIASFAVESGGGNADASVRIWSSPYPSAEVRLVAKGEQLDERGVSYRVERRIRCSASIIAGGLAPNHGAPERLVVLGKQHLRLAGKMARAHVEEAGLSPALQFYEHSVRAMARRNGSGDEDLFPEQRKAARVGTRPPSHNRRPTTKERAALTSTQSKDETRAVQASRPRLVAGRPVKPIGDGPPVNSEPTNASEWKFAAA